MNIQERLEKISEAGVSYKLMGKTLNVSPVALRHYAKGNQGTIGCGEYKVLRLIEQLEHILKIN